MSSGPLVLLTSVLGLLRTRRAQDPEIVTANCALPMERQGGPDGVPCLWLCGAHGLAEVPCPEEPQRSVRSLAH